MWFPGQAINRELRQLMLAVLGDAEIKAELTRQIRIELDNERNKTAIGRTFRSERAQSYESLTSGSVNMQQRMAASGYDVYGRTILGSNRSYQNDNAYRKMKNKIKYGRAPQNGYINRGQFTIE